MSLSFDARREMSRVYIDECASEIANAIDVGASATTIPFTPADTLASTTVQTAIVEALVDARAYSDAVAAGLTLKLPVRAATTGALPANTMLTPGVLTADANGVLPAQDGVTLVATNRLLVKNEGGGTDLKNGLYTVTSVGAAGAKFVLTRTTDADTSVEVVAGAYVFVDEGTAQHDMGFALYTSNPITLNTTALNFDRFKAQAMSMGAIGATPNANAASISEYTLTLQPADGTFGGVLTAGAQNIAGAKTFTSVIAGSAGLGITGGITATTTIAATGNVTGANLSGSSSGANTGDVTLGAVAAVPNANAATLTGQVLTLQPASATFPGVVTTGAQTIAGEKTFSGPVNTSGTLAVTGDITATATIAALGTVTGSNLTGTSSGANTGDQTATTVAFTPADTISATTVQAAVVEALTDARAYADTVAVGLHVHQDVRVATIAALPANTRAGDVLTADVADLLPDIDGVTLVATNRVLVQNEALGENNGWYDVTTVGTAAVPGPGVAWVLTRSAAENTSGEVLTGSWSFVTEGGTHANKGRALYTPAPITLNTTVLGFGAFYTQSISVGAVGAAPNANGSLMTGNVLTLEPASATLPGVVTAGAQSFGGAKTFGGLVTASASLVVTGGITATTTVAATGAVTGSNLTGTNTGDVTLGAVAAVPNANGSSLAGQVLTLQPADGTFPGVVTTGAQTFAGAKTFASVNVGAGAQTAAAAAPVGGAHTVGEIVWNTVPTSHGYVGWVCITAGTPGTWNTFGLVS